MGPHGGRKSVLDRCLFCCSGTTIIPLKTGDGSVLIKEEVDCSGFEDVSPSGSHFLSSLSKDDISSSTNHSVERELRTIFIVRKLLELPLEKCAEYLEHKDGKCNPSSWFSVCPTCDKSVEEGFKIYCQLEKLNEKLKKIKGSLVNTIGKSNEGRHNGTSGKKKEDDDFIFMDVRNVFSEITVRNHPILESTKIGIGNQSLRDRKLLYENNEAFDEDIDEEDSLSVEHWNYDDKDWEPISNQENLDFQKESAQNNLEVEADNNEKEPQDLQQDSKHQATKFYCKLCNVNLVTSRRLFSHLRKWHNDKFPLKCDTCGTGYTTRKSLTSHQKVCKAFVEVSKEMDDEDGKNIDCVNQSIANDEEAAIPEKEIKEIPTYRKAKIVYSFKCELCVAFFQSSNQLKTHRKLHSENIGKACPHCGWLAEENNLQQHIDKRHADKAFVHFEELRSIHRKKLEQQKRPQRPKNVEKRRRFVFMREIPFYCDNCQMIFTSEALLRTHWNTYHSHSPRQFCKICDSVEGFETKQLLELHCKDVHSTDSGKSTVNSTPSEEPQICPHCSKSFPSQLKRDYHIAKLHKSELLKCLICGFRATKYSKYFNHMSTKHEKKTLMCEMCPKSFKTERTLQIHMSVQHHLELGLEPKIKCEECHVICPNAATLRIHVEHVHQKIKQRTCEYCGKAFSTGSDLRRHILLHTAPREQQYKQGPFFCEFCQAKFNVRQGLYYHLKKLHNDKYNFKCENCGTGYVTKNTLLQHQRNCKGKLSPKPSSSSVRGFAADADASRTEVA